jgi:rubrerythrin
VLVVAYSLEDGLRDFYLAMLAKQNNAKVKAIFQKLSDIEIKHKERVFAEYLKVSGKRRTMSSNLKETWWLTAVEGGLTTEEYIRPLSTLISIPLSTSSPWPCPSKPRPWTFTSEAAGNDRRRR